MVNVYGVALHLKLLRSNSFYIEDYLPLSSALENSPYLPQMILAFDTYYFDGSAKTACLAFGHWADAVPLGLYSETLTGIEAYQSGAFYKRELPCILSLLHKMQLQENPEAIIVDGFVYLDDHGKNGLGAHLYEALQGQVPVLGVAKTNFASVEENKRHVLRGQSLRPLYITAIGITLEEAALLIENMHGAYRIPTLLKMLDSLSRAQGAPSEGLAPYTEF